MKSTQITAMNAQYTKMIDTCMTLTNAVIEGYKQAMFVQCEAARTFMQQSATTMKNLMSVTSAKDVAEQVKAFAVSSVESGVAKTQELRGVVSNSQAVFNTAASETIKDAQESMVKSVDQMASVSPALSKVASESLQNIITTSNQAADTVSKVSAQVAEVASKNFEAATQATINTVKKATTAAK
jgi:hypothetical protein